MPKLRGFSTDGEIAAMLLFGGGGLALAAEGVRELAGDGGPVLSALGFGWPAAVAALLAAWWISFKSGPNPMAVRIAAGAVLIAAGGFISATSRTHALGPVLACAAAGAVMAAHGALHAFRERRGMATPPFEHARLTLLAAWLFAVLWLDSVEAALRLSAIAVTAFYGIPAAATARTRFLAWIASWRSPAKPVREAPLFAPPPEEPAGPDDNQRAIADWVDANYGDKWAYPQISEPITSPAYITYVLQVPIQIDVNKLAAATANIANSLARRAEDVYVALDGERRGVLITLMKRTGRRKVWYDEMLADPAVVSAMAEMRESVGHSLLACLGYDPFGKPVILDLFGIYPHLLLAGSSGSGKSSTLHVILAQLLTTASPKDLQFVFIDPKKITAAFYQKVPHLMLPVILGIEKENVPAIKGALAAVTDELNRRERMFAAAEPPAKNLWAWNRRFPDEKCPVLLVVIDETTDLGGPDSPVPDARTAYLEAMSQVARRGRSSGVCAILALQRPSVENIGRNIAGQMSQRIVHKVDKLTESTMALNEDKPDPAATNLVKGGDAFFISTGPRIRFSPGYLPEEPEKDRPDFQLFNVITAIREKYGDAYFSEMVAAAETARKAVEAQHTSECTDREWFILRGYVDAVTVKLPDYVADYNRRRDEIRSAGGRLPDALDSDLEEVRVPMGAGEILPFAKRRIPTAYPSVDEMTASEVADVLRRLIGKPKQDKWEISLSILRDDTVLPYATSDTLDALPPDGAVPGDGSQPDDARAALFRSVADADD